jgi:hypothetical protein
MSKVESLTKLESSGGCPPNPNMARSTKVYLIGGVGLASVEQASLIGSGALKSFSQAGVSLPWRFGHSSVVIGSNIYVVGGSNNNPIGMPGLQRFNANYTQADYARQMPSLTAARGYAASVIIGQYLYVIGGGDGIGGDSVVVERALINADSTLGASPAPAALVERIRALIDSGRYRMFDA